MNDEKYFLVRRSTEFVFYVFLILLLPGCDSKPTSPTPDAGQMAPEHQAYLKEIEKRKAAEKIVVAQCQEQSWEVVKRKGLNITVNKDGATYFSRNADGKTSDHLVGTYHFRFRDADRQNADPRYLHYASYLENTDGTVHLSSGDGAPLFGLFLSLKTDIPSIFKETGHAERIAEIKRVQFPADRPDAYPEADWEQAKARAEFHDDIKVGVFCRPNRESKATWEMAQDQKTTIEDYFAYIRQYPNGYLHWHWSRSRPELGLEEYIPMLKGRPMDKELWNLFSGEKGRREKFRKQIEKDHDDPFTAIYIASDPKLRKPDGGLYTFYCSHPLYSPVSVFRQWRNECYYHYYTPDGSMIHVDFSPHQIKFWREITQYIPTFIESIRVKD